MKSIFWTFIFGIVIFLFGCTNNTTNSGKESEFEVNARVDSLMKLMDLSDKIGQLVLYSPTRDTTGSFFSSQESELIRNGRIGNVFNVAGVAYAKQLQQMAISESPRKIPLLFGYEVIHGHQTIFPIPLAEASSWDTVMIRENARIAAREASSCGINWAFSPMCDLSVDARWSHTPESSGEDPLLCSSIAVARIKGYQGEDNTLAAPFTILACVKHFAAFGAPYAGRECNLIDMSTRMFLEFYLPPYTAAIKQGAMSVMASANDFDFSPATSSTYLLEKILRQQIGFKGFVVSDYAAIPGIVNHGTAANDSIAAMQAINAGIEMDMQGNAYHRYLYQLVKSGVVNETTVDLACRHILRTKFMLGLFDAPFKYLNEDHEQKQVYNAENLNTAYESAIRSMVLLKNDSSVLPLKKGEKIAVFGELANSRRDLLGPMVTDGRLDSVTTILHELQRYNGKENILYEEAVKTTGNNRSGFDRALKTASRADKIICVLGEPYNWSTRQDSLRELSLPGIQTELLEKLTSLKKPIVLVLMNGRALALSREVNAASSILEAWYPGTRGAKAINDLLFGIANPSGKLPVTFPQSLSQVPIFYWEKSILQRNQDSLSMNSSVCSYEKQIDAPLFRFGHGLSYTRFTYSDIKLSSGILTPTLPITLSVTIRNSGKYDGEEVVQIYYQDLEASIIRPSRILCAFRKVALKKGESKEISFTLKPDMFGFYNAQMQFGPEIGKFRLFVGGNLEENQITEFTFK